MNKKLNFAIVGCGRIAARHAVEIQKQGTLIAACDINPVKADEFASKYSAKSYHTIEELFSTEKNIDIVAICTPNGLHAEHSIISLTAGTHVLCEKPMAINEMDAAKMIASSEANNKKLNIVKQNRFNPPVLFVKEFLAQNKLGKIASFQLNCFWNRPAAYYENTWKGTKKLDGGTLFTQFSHFIDIIYWFFGDVKNVSGFRRNDLHKGLIDFEDNGVIAVEMENGIIGSIHYSVNSFQKNMEGSITILGENGTIKIGGQYLNELEYFNVKNEITPQLVKGNTANDYGFYEGSMSNHDKVYEAFVQSIDAPESTLVSASETMKTVAIIEKIYKECPLLP